MTKKITSVEELASLTQNEFVAMGRRIDSRFDNVDKKFDSVDRRFDGIADTLDLMRVDLREVKLILGPLTKNVAALEETVGQLTKRVVGLEDKVGLR